MPDKNLLVLVDGSSYLYRAFHALPQLMNSHGEPTGAMYGVINMLRKLIVEHKSDYIAVIFDAKGKNFRHELFPEYKATRSSMPDELQVQIKQLHEVIEAMGLPLLVIDGVEADDVIGTLAKQAEQVGISSLISTGDKDLAQLVNQNITLINTMTNTVLDINGVKEKFGVTADQMVDYLTLVGDKSDNVPGVPSIGAKTAAKLLVQYGSLDNIIKHVPEIKGKMGENLLASIPQLPMVRALITIKENVPLKVSIKDLVRKESDSSRLSELFARLEFKNWLTETLVGKSVEKIISENYKVVLNEKDFNEWLEKIKLANYFAFDLETDSLDIMDAKIVGVSFATEIGCAAYVPVGHDYDGAPKQLECDYVLNKLRPLLENESIHKLGQNLKFDMSVLANYAIELKGVVFDTMLAAYVLNSSNNRYDKETLVLQYLGKSLTTFADLAGKGAKQITFDQVKIEDAAPYAATDADLVLQLHEILGKKLLEHEKLANIFKAIEIPLLNVLSHMERQGVMIDAELLQQQSKELSFRLENIEKDAYEIAGKEFNLNSPLQLQEILFDKLGLPILYKTPKGQPSTAEQTLQELALEYPLPKLIIEYRSLSKLKSTYTDSLPQQINHKTQRIHTSYNQAVTTTGRLSSTNPNLQNIPIRTEEGRRIRKAFIAPKGCSIVSVDYSQIELRIMAHLSQDVCLLKAFASDSDIHRATAAEVFGVPLIEVTTLQRQRAKAINFGLIYGMSAFGLAKRLDLSRAAAQGYIDLYFKRYPGVKKYMEETQNKAQQLGYVETIFGRCLHIPEIKSKNFQRHAAAVRAAINAPMQGSAADMMKIAMISVDHWIQQTDLDVKMIMQVHDELVFEIAEQDVQSAVLQIKERMENVIMLDVPVLAHVGVGNNWDEAH